MAWQPCWFMFRSGIFMHVVMLSAAVEALTCLRLSHNCCCYLIFIFPHLPFFICSPYQIQHVGLDLSHRKTARKKERLKEKSMDTWCFTPCQPWKVLSGRDKMYPYYKYNSGSLLNTHSNVEGLENVEKVKLNAWALKGRTIGGNRSPVGSHTCREKEERKVASDMCSPHQIRTNGWIKGMEKKEGRQEGRKEGRKE